MTDQRPDPKPRKHALLWQAYLMWDEFMQMNKKHKLRYDAATKGKTQMDAGIEDGIIGWLSPAEENAKKTMIAYGKQAGPIWDWLTGIKGIGDHTAAKLIALFDDPGKFATVSKWWRFSGWAVIDGRRERNTKGEKSHYNCRLKSECFLVGKQFIKHQTPLYADVYYDRKLYIRGLHPEPEPAPEGPWKQKYTDLHIHRRAIRYAVKMFLSHFWVAWRTAEDLPVTLPYVLAHMERHTHYIEAAEGDQEPGEDPEG